MASTHRISPPAALSPEQSGAPQPGTKHEQLTYLREILELLWPPPASVTLNDEAGFGYPASPYPPHHPGPAQAGTEFLVLPGFRSPRLLVPVASRPAAAAVRHYGTPRSRLARLSVKALSAGLASGLGPTVLGGRIRVNAHPMADTIETYLADALGRDIQVSMHLGPARANRKPVLQLLTPAGETIGFAKIGVNPLTCGLVRAEHDSLELLAAGRVEHIAVPSVLHYGEWHGLEVLVISPLPVWLRRRRLAAGELAAAMREVSGLAGVTSEPLDGTYLAQLRERLASADDGDDRDLLMQALDVLRARAGGSVLAYGAWHGDWTQWNMASTEKGLLVWDWERFAPGVPAGFDALHHWLHTEVGPGRQREPRTVAAELAEQAARLLTPYGIGPAEARLTAIAYLAELSTRYLVDRQAQAGARRGAPGQWLIPAIEDEVARL